MSQDCDYKLVGVQNHLKLKSSGSIKSACHLSHNVISWMGGSASSLPSSWECSLLRPQFIVARIPIGHSTLLFLDTPL